jgi:hypothetical protein
MEPQPPSADSTRPKQQEVSCGIERSDGEYWRWCPRCGSELQNHKCKLLCPRCGYFMSCSDFD